MKLSQTLKAGVLSVILCVALAACSTPWGVKKITTEQGTFLVPNCYHVVAYSKNSFTIKGVEIPTPNVPVKIGEVTVKPEVLQQAHTITQILDMHRMSNCQLLPSFASISKEQFRKALEKIQNDETILTHLSLIVASNDGGAINRWVETYGPQVKSLPVQQMKTQPWKTADPVNDEVYFGGSFEELEAAGTVRPAPMSTLFGQWE